MSVHVVRGNVEQIKMIVTYFIFWLVVRAATTAPQLNVDGCLTGYMTDVQTWVDARGRLTNTAPRANRVDVSYQNGTIQKLVGALREFECTRQGAAGVVKYLSMARCQLQQVPRVFGYGDTCGQILSTTVTYLTLYGNDFGPKRSHEAVIKINNNIDDSWSFGLRGIRFQNLRELDLRLCGITELEDGIFSNMINLDKLYLGENNIYTISERTFRGLMRLRHLDISRIDGGIHFGDVNVFTGMESLNALDLSFTKLAQRDLLALRAATRSLQTLSICHSGLSNLGTNFFSNTSIRFLDVSGNSNIFDDIGALRGLESSSQVIYAGDVALRHMRVFENLTSLEILRVSNNEISSIDRNTIRSLRNLQVLIMDTNRLTTWFTPIISLMPRLKLLSLRNNNINLISEDMVTDFRNLSYIGVSGNNIVCNCNARELYEVAARNENVRADSLIYPLNNKEVKSVLYHTGFKDVNRMIAERMRLELTCSDGVCDESGAIDAPGSYLIFDYDLSKYHCMQAMEGRSLAFGRVPFCKTREDIDYEDVIAETWNTLYLLTVPALLLPICILGYIFRWNVRYFFITIRNSAMLSLINKDEVIDENTIFNYDVFVSYCHEDRDWVLDQLLPHVEVDANVSVCLHERDFMVGLSILENIVSCMDRSKTILLILSQKFLLSQWCQFEMHLAQHRLLETRREDLILVLLEEIPRRVRPNTLHYLMMTNTYIVWPQEEAEQPVFWRRLNKSLITHKMRQSSTDSLA
ncbi:PREDICTED: toll-like receptor 6 [Papilio xuthus]|uniref:Toll-like receptor 6 n=1 Tax=Papilio xuthus TaxID=66420 RepID=A0AAJ6ZPE5_PAPXU|nr:PREDICTED: toll-like receptor 6 [Papilio xuthus]XP_013176710.1 PREDICTED: toll-like receptor 6 [Papilio xuthus]